MAERSYNVKEALAILRAALGRQGLGDVTISVNAHNLTPAGSAALVRELITGGFGDVVTESGRAFPYQGLPGRYSWVTIAQGRERINLFYNL